MNRTVFFDKVRDLLFKGSMKQSQVDGLNFIIDQWNETGFTNRQWLAYALATAFHETAFTMQPIREFGRGKGKKYGTTYYGRGYVQLTWLVNYRKASQHLGIDFVKNPDLVMDPENAAYIMFQGMADGWFTGKEFADYISAGNRDYYNARRIINGTDKAGEIADYAIRFEAALDAAAVAGDTPKPIPAPTPPDQTDSLLWRVILAIWRLITK